MAFLKWPTVKGDRMAHILTGGLGFAHVEDIKGHLRPKTKSSSVFNDLQTMDLPKIPSPRRDAIAALSAAFRLCW
jgi:hypothetical protein